MKLRISLFLLITVGLLGTASATPIINVGNIVLLPNTPNQLALINVTGGDLVQGLNFRVQVENAFGTPTFGLPPDGPNITAVDLLTGTIFAPNNTGQNSVLTDPQLQVQSVVTSSGTVAASGVLATLTIDTTGFFTGSYSLKLSGTLDGDTDFAPTAALITNGSITVVPEPTTIGLVSCAVLCCVIPAFRRMRRARASM